MATVQWSQDYRTRTCICTRSTAEKSINELDFQHKRSVPVMIGLLLVRASGSTLLWYPFDRAAWPFHPPLTPWPALHAPMRIWEAILQMYLQSTFFKNQHDTRQGNASTLLLMAPPAVAKLVSAAADASRAPT